MIGNQGTLEKADKKLRGFVMGAVPKKVKKDAIRPALRVVEPSVALDRRPLVAIVVPAYNEEQNLPRVFEEIDRLRQAHPAWRFLPVVVNDGSTDRTRDVLEELGPRYGAVALHMPVNVGIGRTVQAGLRYAIQNLSPQVLLQLDGDGQHPAGEIPRIVTPILLGQADVVVGSRYVAGAGGRVSSPLRRLGTAFFSLLLRLTIGVRILDTTSGFRAFGAEAGEFLSRYYPDDYPEVEAYVPLARREFRIVEVPVTMRPRKGGRSSITPIRSLYYMLKVAFATVIDRVRPLPPRRRSR
jgi:glycosyltransferase involved in cell wall biosynthesis